MWKPCPFCGCHLKITPNGAYHPNVKESGTGTFCIVKGCHIGNELKSLWNGTKHNPQIGYTVVEGYPLFTDNEHSIPVTPQSLNQMFGYMRQKLAVQGQ